MISVAQIKAAGAMLGWSTQLLAEAAGVSVATIKKYEQQTGIPRANARILDSIVRSLNAAGGQFTGDPLSNPGVTLNLEKRVQFDD
jgi:transcriptional regulator with XRE-family HTH domain